MQNKSFRFALTALGLSSMMLLAPATASAFADDLSDFQTWGNVTATGSLGALHPDLGKIKYWIEGQGRFGDNTSRFSQGLIRPGIGYQLTETTSIWAGYAWAPTSQPFARKDFDEHRVWQQVLWRDRFSFGTVTSRTRMEERMAPALGNDVGLRFRQLFKLSVPLSFAPGFSLIAQDEVFVALNSNDWVARRGIDNNRAFFGVGYSFNKNVSTELGYMNHYIVRRGANLMDHILAVNLFLNF